MKKPCGYPGCPTLIESGRHCAKHQRTAPNARRDYDRGKRKDDASLSASKNLRDSIAWKAVRNLKRAQSPLCEDPHGDHARGKRSVTATQVPHIEPLATHPELALSLDNLMSVCTSCHAKTEAAVRREEP